MATGKMPFGQPEKLAHVKRRLWRDPEPPRALRQDIPEWLQEVILRSMEVDPAKRTQTAAQLLFDLTHPAQVKLTERAHKMVRDNWLTVFRRWRVMRRLRGFPAPPSIASQMERTPILMVAVDLSPEMEPLADQIRRTVTRMLAIQPDMRVACVNVIKTARIGLDMATDDAGNNRHVTRLVGLRAWAEGIELGEDRLTFSILENPDPAAALIAHAETAHVDHIVMGARANSATRRFLGSVSAKVVAEAPCSVTVMRLPQVAEAEIAT
jgi:eukaryotic-like serine/threonine-protein kinase